MQHTMRLMVPTMVVREEFGLKRLFGRFNTSTGGAITTQDCNGFSVEKVSGQIGLYNIYLEEPYEDIHMCHITYEFLVDGTNTAGTQHLIRNIRLQDPVRPRFYLEFIDVNNPQQPEELEDGCVIRVSMVFKKLNSESIPIDRPDSNDLVDELISQLPDETEEQRNVKEAIYRLTEKLKDIFGYYEKTIGDLIDG